MRPLKEFTSTVSKFVYVRTARVKGLERVCGAGKPRSHDRLFSRAFSASMFKIENGGGEGPGYEVELFADLTLTPRQGLSEVIFFIRFCQILAMKLNVCKEITSMDLNGKTIVHYNQMCLPGFIIKSFKQIRLTLKTVQPNSISKAHITIRFNLLHFWPSVPSFVFAVLLKCSFSVLSGYFYISPNFMVISHAYIRLKAVTQLL